MGNTGLGKDTDISLDVLADMVPNRLESRFALEGKMLHRSGSHILQENTECYGHGLALYTPLYVRYGSDEGFLESMHGQDSACLLTHSGSP